MKKLAGLVLGVMTAILAAGTAFAGAWRSDANGYWYQRDDGTWPEAKWEYVDGHWYVFDVHGYWINPNDLAVKIIPNTAVDCGDYWIVTADYQVPIPVPENTADGARSTIVVNAITGESKNFVFYQNYLIPLDAPARNINHAEYYVSGGNVWYAFGSDDLAYWTVYRGPLYIRKSVTRVQILINNSSLAFDPNRDDWINSLAFDEDGYVNYMAFVGD